MVTIDMRDGGERKLHKSVKTVWNKIIEKNIRTIVYGHTICMFFVTKIKKETGIPNIGRYQIFVLFVPEYVF